MPTKMVEGHSKVPKVQDVMLGITFIGDQLVVLVQPCEPAENGSYQPKGEPLPVIGLPVKDSPMKEIAEAIQWNTLSAVAGFVPVDRSPIKRLMEAIFADPVPGTVPGTAKQ